MTLGALEWVVDFYFCIHCSFYIDHMLSEIKQKIFPF